MTTRNATGTETPEQLVTSLRSLLAEAEQLISDSAGEFAGQKAEELHAKLDDATARLQHLYGRTRERVAAGARRADECIRTHPYESLAVALGVGVLLGAMLRRNA